LSILKIAAANQKWLFSAVLRVGKVISGVEHIAWIPKETIQLNSFNFIKADANWKWIFPVVTGPGITSIETCNFLRWPFPMFHVSAMQLLDLF